MPYQSILGKQPSSSSGSFASDFVPGQYASINRQISIPQAPQFKDTPQGQAYKQTFSQADAQTQKTIANRLVARAQAGDKRSYDQLQAIKDVYGTTANPVKVAGPFRNGLANALSNAVSPGGGITRAAGQVGAAVLQPAFNFAANDKVQRAPNIGGQLLNTLKSTAGFTKSIVGTGYQNSPIGALEQNIAKGAATVHGSPVSLPGVGPQTSYTSDIGSQSGAGGKVMAALSDLAGLAYGVSGAKSFLKASEVGAAKALAPTISNATKANIVRTLHDAGETNLAVNVARASTPAELKTIVQSPAVARLHPTLGTPPGEVPSQVNPQNSGVASENIKHIPADSLKLGTETHGVPIDTAQVAKVAADIQAGKPIEPLIVKTIDGTPYVQDGQHRLEALKAAGVKNIPTVEQLPKTTLAPAASTGQLRTSKLGAGINQKAVEAKLTTGLSNLPEYNQVNMKEQAAHAADLIQKDPQRATRIATGQEAPPPHILPESISLALEDHATKTGNVDLLQQLATSSRVGEATAMGQRIRALAERNPNSAVGNIQKVADARAKALEAKTGQSVNKAVTATTKEVQAAKPKVTRQTWEQFVNEIRC
jgi:hypothetical protein